MKRTAHYFHATWRESLPSIMQNGLDPTLYGRNYKCEKGVYLAASFDAAHFMLADCYLQANPRASDRSKRLKDIRVIIIDETRLDMSRLASDPQYKNPNLRTWRYMDRIDVEGCPIRQIAEPQGLPDALRVPTRGE